MTTFPTQDSFVRGEITPRLHARSSLDLYRSALAKCENFITLPHGGLRKRSGTYFAGETKASGFERPYPFIFSEEQAYCLFFGANYFRVYAYGGPVLSGMTVVEVATPYTVDQVKELQFQQSGDVLYLTHPAHLPRRVKRQSNTAWSIEILTYIDGPFGIENATETTTAYASASTGTISVVANAAIFTADMIGQLIKVQAPSFGSWRPWEPGQVLKSAAVTGDTNVNGMIRRYGTFVYEALQLSPPVYPGAGDIKIMTGATPPVHLRGDEWDGPESYDLAGYDPDGNGVFEARGMIWRYLHSGFGVGEITAISGGGTIATVNALSYFPPEVVGGANATYRWSLGGFGGAAGYPRSVAIYEERLCYGQKYSVYGSKTFDFRKFRTGAADDDAVSFQLAGANDITWLQESDGFLLVGTIAGVRTLSGGGNNEQLTPSSFKNRGSPTKRCSSIPPVKAGSTFVYVGFDRRSVVEMSFSLERNGYSTTPVSLISEHIPKKGISSLTYQSEPDAIFWLGLDDGQLAGLTYEADQNVRGWHRHPLGGSFGDVGWGVIEWVACTPGRLGADDVWLVVKRTINGVTRRHIEVLQAPFEYGAVEDAFMVDCGLTYEGAPANSMSGLSHLEGEAVAVLADGVVYKGLTVASGSISLPGGATAAKWHAGLPYTAVAETLELDVGGRDGSVTGRRKRVNSVIFSVLESANIYVKSTSRNGFELHQAGRNTIAPASSTVSLFTGNLDAVHIEDSWEGQGRIRIEAPDPVPCTIRAVIPGFDSEGS
jgi:hypothetical protein